MAGNDSPRANYDVLALETDQLLAADDAERRGRYPGPVTSWQPVHTVYVPADVFTADTVTNWGAAALASMDEFGPLPELAQYEQAVRRKLAVEPIEDLRIDFEDGYGLRSDREEDEAVVAAADAVRVHRRAANLPRAWGIRMKCLEPAVRSRAIRTLSLFVGGLVEQGELPDGFRITLPKVTSVAQVAAMVNLCQRLEAQCGLSAGTLRFEIQVETPQAVLGADGVALIAPMLHAARGRCAGLHYGTYDYSASVGIAAEYQSMEHPAADYAKAVMQVAAAGTGVAVCDGSTNVLPIGNRSDVQAAWALHSRLVRRSMERGFYQGWDLHPAQLPTRFAATFSFYAAGLPAAVRRLSTYLARATGGVLDEPATARALAGFLVRGMDCGALSVADLAAELATLEDAPTLDRAVLQRIVVTGL